MNDLAELADLIKEKNEVDGKIANMIGRPVQVGHAGEFIAAAIFGIQLHPSASYGSSDGFFLRVPLTGHSVTSITIPCQIITLSWQDQNLRQVHHAVQFAPG